MITLDLIGHCLLRDLIEAEEDIKAIKTLPKEILMNSAFSFAFDIIGIRDQKARDLANHFLYIPCAEIDITPYREAFGSRRNEIAHHIGQKALALWHEGDTP